MPGPASGSDRDLELYADSRIPTERGPVQVVVFREPADAGSTGPPQEHMALVVGDVAGRSNVLSRLHSECWTGEVLHSLKCDCREQLHMALAAMIRSGCGVVVYLRQEGRGIGLGNKIRAYALQEQGLDTVEANRALGFPDDARDYSAAALILRQLGVQSVHLMTNNPNKVRSLDECGISVTARMPMEVPCGPHSIGYLATKNRRMGHLIPLAADEQDERVTGRSA